MSDDPNVVTRRTRVARTGCADCWHWVVDCDHIVWPLRIPHRLMSQDSFIHGFAYDPIRRCLEIRYRWKSAAQCQPITASMFRQLTGQPHIRSVLDEWIKERRITRNKSERKERS